MANYEDSKSILPTISTPMEITMIGIIAYSFNFENGAGFCEVLITEGVKSQLRHG